MAVYQDPSPLTHLDDLAKHVGKIYTAFEKYYNGSRDQDSLERPRKELWRLACFVTAFKDLPPVSRDHQLPADRIEFFKKINFLLNLSDYVDNLNNNIEFGEERKVYAGILKDLKNDLNVLKKTYGPQINELNKLHKREREESKLDQSKARVVLESLEQIHDRYEANAMLIRNYGEATKLHDEATQLIAKLAQELKEIPTIRMVDKVKGLAKWCEIIFCGHLEDRGIPTQDLNKVTQQQIHEGRKRSNYFLLLEEARYDLNDVLGAPIKYYPRRITNSDELAGRLKRLLEKQPKAEHEDKAELKIKTGHKEELYDLLDMLTALDQNKDNNLLLVSSMVDSLYDEYLKNHPDKTRYNVPRDHDYFYFIKWLKNDLDQFKKQLPLQNQEKKEDKQERNNRPFIERIKNIDEEYKRDGGRDREHLGSLGALARYAKRLDGASALTDNQKEQLIQARISKLHQQFLQKDNSASQRYSALLNREAHRQAAPAANRQPQVKAGQTLCYIPKNNEKLIAKAEQLFVNAAQLWERLHQAEPLREGLLGRLQDRSRHDDLSKLRNLALGPGSTLEKLSAIFDEVERQRKAYPDSKNKTYSALLNEIASEIYSLKKDIQGLQSEVKEDEKNNCLAVAMTPPSPVEKVGAEVELNVLHRAADAAPTKAAAAHRPGPGGGK